MKKVIKRIIKVLLTAIAMLIVSYIAITAIFSFQGVYFSFSFPKLGWKVWEPNWSPAGNLIALRCIYISSKNWDYDSYDLHNRSDICVTDQNGNQFQVLTSGGSVSNFSWSPDGKKLAWAHESDLAWESISIWDNQKQTTETFPLSTEIQWLSHLAWSKDAQEIYLGDSGAIFDIATGELSLPPGQKVEGTDFFDFIRSSDGEYLALGRPLNFPDGQADLVITRDAEPVYIGYEAHNSSVYSWSPADDVLAWTGAAIAKDLQDPEKDYDDVLFLTYAPTGETIKYETLDRGFFDISSVIWSPDGTKLAISDTGYSSFEVFKFAQTDQGFPLSMADHYQIDLRKPGEMYLYLDDELSWSPDGRHIIFEGDEQLWLVDVQNSEVQEFRIDFHDPR